MNVMSLQPLRSPMAKALLVATLIVGSVVAVALAAINAALPDPVPDQAQPARVDTKDDDAPPPWLGAQAALLDVATVSVE